MDSAWQTLIGAGLPLGAVRPPAKVPLNYGEELAIASAVRQLEPNLAALDDTRRDCLLAWLRAFRHHWPRRFERVLGLDGSTAIRALEPLLRDRGRYLKLRRIAVENLAAML